MPIQRTTPLALAAIITAALAAISLGARPAAADPGDEQIPAREIVRHVVPRDAIPALIQPKYATPAEATFMRPDDRVITLEFNGEHLAYPIRILEHHEIVNDLVGGRPITVTY